MEKLKVSDKNVRGGKRKTKQKSVAGARKKSKIVDVGDVLDENEIREPSKEELEESMKPENQIAIETIRQKKLKSHSKNIDNWKLNFSVAELRRNVEYLNKWKEDRDSWKFEKLRQISIQKCVFDEEKLPETIWETVIAYLGGCKGGARDELIEKSEEIIKSLDQQPETEFDSKNKIKYKRARDMLQILQ